MTTARWEEIKKVFNGAMEKPPAERAAFVEQACAGDAELRSEVESLLLAVRPTLVSGPVQTGGAAQVMAGATATAFSMLPLTERAGTLVGPYKLLETIGEGGFGTVFLADQTAPVRRRVALKIIKLGMDTRSVIARFEAERQALALMDHPNIAKVFDGGATESGRPYFVMEYVKGDPITLFADAHRLTLRERLGLLTQVCHAVQHAHQKGIIHRDIKPSNVLVSMVDGKPLAKVIDFGIAKATGAAGGTLTDKTLFTEHRTLIGTPEYMSPEQAEGSPDIDTRTDVYGLGVLMYELLTGTTPFESSRLRSAAYAEMQRIIREEEPPSPSVRVTRDVQRDLGKLASTAAQRKVEPQKLNALMRGELDWIVMKALDKDRSRRFATPQDLGADIERHLRGEAVVAAPASAAYRVRKFVRRNKGAALTAGAVAITLLVGLSATLWMARIARVEASNARAAETEQRRLALAESDARKTADAETAKASAQREAFERASYIRNIRAASRAIEMNEFAAARESLNECPERLRGWEWGYLDTRLDDSVLNIPGPDGHSAMLSADGSRIVTSAHGAVNIFDASGKLQQRLAKDGQVMFADVSPDGGYLLAILGETTVELSRVDTGVVVYSRTFPKPIAALVVELIRRSSDWATFDRTVFDSIAESAPTDLPESNFIICGEGNLLAYEIDYGKAVGVLNLREGILHPVARLELPSDEQIGRPVALCARNYLLLCNSFEGRSSVWNARSGELVREIVDGKGPGGIVFSAGALTSDGRYAATPIRSDGSFHVWRIDSGEEVFRSNSSAFQVSRMSFSPDGSLLAANMQGGSAFNDDRVNCTVWDCSTGEMVAHLGDQASVSTVDFGFAIANPWSADGKGLLTVDPDGVARKWHIGDRAGGETRFPASGVPHAFFPGDEHTPPSVALALPASGSHALKTQLRIFNAHTGAAGLTIEDWPMAPNTMGTYERDASLWSNDGRFLVTRSNPVCVYDAVSGAKVTERDFVDGSITAARVISDHTDGRIVYVELNRPEAREVVRWDRVTNDIIPVARWTGPAREILGAVSPDMSAIILTQGIAEADDNYSRSRLIFAAPGRLDAPVELAKNVWSAPMFVFSGDGTSIFGLGSNTDNASTIELVEWNASDGTELRRILIPYSPTNQEGLSISADSRWLVISRAEWASLTMVDLHAWEIRWTRQFKRWTQFDALAISPDGSRVFGDRSSPVPLTDIFDGRDGTLLISIPSFLCPAASGHARRGTLWKQDHGYPWYGVVSTGVSDAIRFSVLHSQNMRD
jgi:serine/threonine protein kinase/WD40 repeat protein